jgi:hypothetical protein
MERASDREFRPHRRQTSRRREAAGVAGGVKIAIVVFVIAMFCVMALLTLKSNRRAYQNPAEVGAWQF